MLCFQNRRFLQIVTVDGASSPDRKLRFDPEWLAILRSTNHLLSVERKDTHMPGSYLFYIFNSFFFLKSTHIEF
jgi:hypothetical protein